MASHLFCLCLLRVLQGSAAIYGLRGKKGVNCFILYPKGRVSLIQEQQMTTVPDANIRCIRVEGTFDDCQVNYLGLGGKEESERLGKTM
jgi:hypothetical protein